MKTIITKKDFIKSYMNLVDVAELDVDFVFLAISATVLCVIGLAIDNAAIVIGAMVISPLLHPLIAIPATLVQRDFKGFFRSLLFLLGGAILVVGLAYIISLFWQFEATGYEIISRLNISHKIYFVVALFSGLAGTFCFFWPKIQESVTGIAISIALLPPLCLLGINLVSDGEFLKYSALIVLYNVVGILIGSLFSVVVIKCFIQKDKI